MHFADRLMEAIKVKGSPICVGLDPRLNQIPDFIKKKWIAQEKNPWNAAGESILDFNKGIIDAIYDLAPAVKPQLAFYELYGMAGIKAFQDTVKYAKEKGLIVIADAKRNDVDSTATAYSKAYLGLVELFGEEVKGFDVDALTVNGYLGYNGVKPFIEECKKFEKGIFILVKTSNPTSSEFQDVVSKEDNLTNYEIMASLTESWGANDLGKSGYSFVGAVVSATFPKAAERLRVLMPNTIFLVPGYGAQGAKIEDVKFCFNKDGSGALINNSRGIIFAYMEDNKFSGENYKEAARNKVMEMKKSLSALF